MKNNVFGKLLTIGIITTCLFGCGNTVEDHVCLLTKHSGQTATCLRDGYEAYYSCDECGKMYSDLNGENEIYSPVIIPKGQHSLVKTEAKESTCLEAGHDAYWTCDFCYKMFSDENATSEIQSVVKKPLGNHNIVKVPAKAATEITAGIKEHYRCDSCNKIFSDEKGTNEISINSLFTPSTSGMTWTPMSDIANPSDLGYSNGEISFEGVNSSYYLDNVFTDNNNRSLVGAYDSTTANTEYTYSMDVSATGTFALVLYCNELCKTTYVESDIVNGVAKKLGFYLRFDSDDKVNNLKLEAALGNNAARLGISAVGASSFKFDGTKNNVSIRLERYSVDKIIFHISVNGQEIIWTKITGSNKGVDYYGFNFRTAWDRTNLVDGIGKSYIKTEESYPTLACSRGLTETEGYGSGLGVAVIGRLEENNTKATGKVGTTDTDVLVKISNLKKEKTGEQVLAK